jgi:phosphohistidine phosphatase
VTDEGPVRLHLLRHADAGDPENWQGDDATRPLSEKGVRQAETLGRHLALIGFEADAILSSPKLRAIQTAEAVGRALGATVTTDDRLAGSLDPRRVSTILRDAGSPRKPVLVGHDPDFSELLAELVDAPRLSMKKGAIARVDLAEGIQAGSGVLRWLLPPDLVPDGAAGASDPAKRTPRERKRRPGAG